MGFAAMLFDRQLDGEGWVILNTHTAHKCLIKGRIHTAKGIQ